jgi:thiamine-phosphate pyrophosphorylase
MTDRNQLNGVLPCGIYGITAEKFSAGRTNVEVVRAMIAGGIRIIQYREKRPTKSFSNMLDECHQIRLLTREADVLLIINDYVDIAQMVDADGVHVGQDDFPVAAVRRLIGPGKIIGLSTHSPEQAAAAVLSGADYIGVGPIFCTTTKEDVCAPVGLAYLDIIGIRFAEERQDNDYAEKAGDDALLTDFCRSSKRHPDFFHPVSQGPGIYLKKFGGPALAFHLAFGNGQSLLDVPGHGLIQAQ